MEKKMKKKIILMSLSILTAVVLFSGCSGGKLASEPHWPDEGTQAYIEKIEDNLSIK